MTDSRRVVVTGLGVATPVGIGIAQFWDAVLEGRSGIGPIQAFDASALPSSLGGEVPAFKTTDFVPKTYRKSVKLMSRDIELAVVAAFEAAKDAALPTLCLRQREIESKGELDPARFGANIGAGLICPDLNELAAAFATAINDEHRFDLKTWGDSGMDNLTPLWLLKYLPNMLACHVTIVHDAEAMSNTITCAEASSHLAIGEAFRAIARGAVDVCICGGAESKMNPMGVARAALAKRLVTDTDVDPPKACRPLAANRCGTIASEGSGLVILESLDHARDRGARIYAELIGFGAAGNATGGSAPDASGQTFALAVRNALADANTSPASVDLVTVFGCGTREHDAAEINGWNHVLGKHADNHPALANKGIVGNNGAGSGAIDFCATVLTVHHTIQPPSINATPTDPQCGFRFAPREPIDCQIGIAVSAAHALGGAQNAALVVKRFLE